MIQKRLITISRFHIAAVLFFCIGLLLFFDGIIRLHALKEAIPLSSLTVNGLKKGIYVKDEVKTVAGIWYDNGGKKIFLGSSLHYINLLGQDYDFYTAEIANGSEYITIMERESENGLSSLTDKETKHSVPITGRVVKIFTEPNYERLTEMLSADTREELALKISSKYALLVTDEKKEKLVWIKGISLMITGILFWFIGNIRRGYLTVILKGKQDGNKK